MSLNTICIIRETEHGDYEHHTQSIGVPDSKWAITMAPTLVKAINWHNEHCESEYGLSIQIEKDTPMQDKYVITTFVRKPFEVQAIKIDDDNINDVANWCGGKIIKTRTGVPFIEVPTNRSRHPNYSRAFIGSWVVTGKEGYFSSYTDRAFHRTFEHGRIPVNAS